MCIATADFTNTGLYRAVNFDGQQPDRDHEDDEIPAWVVYVGGDQAEPTDTVYTLHEFTAAKALTKRMAHDCRLDLIHEASPA